MRCSTLFAAVVLAGSALVAAEPMPYKLIVVGTRSANPAYGLAKRKDGYQPTEVRCGPGADCAASCGSNYIQCPSNDGALHCYDPTVKKERCCPDGNGYSCREGYTCTSDSVGATWCCPDGMDLVTCARNYHLTDSLVAQSPTATPMATPNAPYQYQYPNTTTISGTGGIYPYSSSTTPCTYSTSTTTPCTTSTTTPCTTSTTTPCTTSTTTPCTTSTTTPCTTSTTTPCTTSTTTPCTTSTTTPCTTSTTTPCTTSTTTPCTTSTTTPCTTLTTTPCTTSTTTPCTTSESTTTPCTTSTTTPCTTSSSTTTPCSSEPSYSPSNNPPYAGPDPYSTNLGYPSYPPVGTAPYGTAPYGTAPYIPYGTAPPRYPKSTSRPYYNPPPMMTVAASPSPSSPPSIQYASGAAVYTVGLPAVLAAAVVFAFML